MNPKLARTHGPKLQQSLAQPGRLLWISLTRPRWASVHRKCFEVTTGEKLEESQQQLAQPLSLLASVGAFVEGSFAAVPDRFFPSKLIGHRMLCNFEAG